MYKIIMIKGKSNMVMDLAFFLFGFSRPHKKICNFDYVPKGEIPRL